MNVKLIVKDRQINGIYERWGKGFGFEVWADRRVFEQCEASKEGHT
jgi:hypothetical protein